MISAFVAGTILTAVLSATSARAESYSCMFTAECLGANPCGEAFATPADITRETDGWSLSLLGQPYPIKEIELPESRVLHFILAPVDDEADAVSLHSVFDDGQAFLTTNGDFLEPTTYTLAGECIRENG